VAYCACLHAIVLIKIGDKRFERERAYQLSTLEKGIQEPQSAVSSTFDAFQRMAAGLDARKMADKIADPNRPTWEQYKKENEDKLDLVGVEVRNMVEYRAQLDEERNKRLSRAVSHGKKDSAISESGMLYSFLVAYYHLYYYYRK